MEEINFKIESYANSIKEEVINNRRILHKIPELGNDLPKTRQFILDELAKLDVEVRENVGKNGISALLRGGKDGKTIAYRADMDALPITEISNCEYKSLHESAMHACGHDAHVALSLSVLKVLSSVKEEIEGNIKFIFQPAEETSGGAHDMIEDGVLENPKVDYIFGSHVWPNYETGKIGLRKGPIMAGSDIIEITIQGRGGHAAMPHEAINPVVIGSKIVSEIEAIKCYFVSALDKLVISVCTMNAGDVYNVIPHSAKLTGTVRCFSKEVQEEVIDRLQKVVKNIANIYDAKCELNYIKNYPPVINDTNVISSVINILSDSGHEGNIISIPDPSMGAEDFSFFLNKVPGAFFFIGTGNSDKNTTYPLHNPSFNIDEDMFAIIIPKMCKIILGFLNGKDI